MKDIIYLDTAFIHSFIAQTNHGLPTNITREITEQDTKTTSEGTQGDALHEVLASLKTGTIPLIIVNPSGDITYKYQSKEMQSQAYSLSQLDAGKEIISKQLHDNALNEFEKYLEEHEEFTCTIEDIKFGKYVKIKSEFSLFDLTYIQNFFDPDMTKKLIQLFESLSNPSTQTIPKKGQLKNKIDPQIENGIDLFQLMTRYLFHIIPTGLCLKQNKYISPLKNDYLREKSSEMIFKYGTSSQIEITVLGKVTREFDSFGIDMFNKEREFAALSDSTTTIGEELLKQVNILQKGDIIISPVAIYFE